MFDSWWRFACSDEPRLEEAMQMSIRKPPEHPERFFFPSESWSVVPEPSRGVELVRSLMS